MASSVSLFIALLLLFVTVSPLRNRVDAIPVEELDAMIAALSSRGYNRIGNAIATSDLSFDFLAADNLTLFAPSDSPLFTLDMTLPATSYLSALRSHAVPRCLSVSDLILFPPSTLLPTLLSNRTLNVTVERGDLTVTVAVNGVQLEAPGLYGGSHVAVHGLAGALSFLSDHMGVGGTQINTSASPLPPIPPFQGTLPLAAEPEAALSPLSRWLSPSPIDPPPCCDLDLPPQAETPTQIIPDVSRAFGLRKRDRVASFWGQEEPRPTVGRDLRRSLFQRYIADTYSLRDLHLVFISIIVLCFLRHLFSR